ncbi:MAG: DUF5615 family PIN-like protein [Euzebya sp.]
MKFLVDAQLPRRLAALLNDHGYDTIHTHDLPDGNRSSDRDVSAAADDEDRVVVTKDRDFRDSHLLTGRPGRLLVVSTGNIRNRELMAIFEDHLSAILDLFTESEFLELTADQLIAH